MLDEAVDFLRLRAAELDTLELDPQKKGFNSVIQRPPAAVEGADPGEDPGSPRVSAMSRSTWH